MWAAAVLASLAFCFPGATTLRWTSSLQDGATVVTCVGDDIRLPWSYALDGADRTTRDVQWYLRRPGQANGEVFANYLAGHVLTSGGLHVQYVPNAGVVIEQVAEDDAGQYSVHVNVDTTSGSVVTYTRSADVIVAVAPNVSDDRLHLEKRPGAAVDNHTGQWAVELQCGHFSSLGQPSVTVDWKLPSGATRKSSYYGNGTFVLTLTDPAESGNYSCELSHDSPATTCIANDSHWLDGTSLYVDGNEVKAAIAKAREGELMFRIHQLELEKEQLANQTLACKAEKAGLEDKVLKLSNQTQTCERQKNDTAASTQDTSHHPTSCLDVLQYDRNNGVHVLYPTQHGPPMPVYCDQTTDGGGWAVFQRRQDGSVDFFRNWTEYQRGFGDLRGEFWLGLESLHLMTSATRQELRVDLTDWEGHKGYAKYSGFLITDSTDNYRLHFDSFTGGNAGDSLSRQNDHQFSTPGADHDDMADTECARDFHGAWWYSDCHDSSLNADYKQNSSAKNEDGLLWFTFSQDYHYSMKFTEMKMRPM